MSKIVWTCKTNLISSNTLVTSQLVATAPLCHGRHAPGFFQPAPVPRWMPRPNNSIFRNPSVAVAPLVVDTISMLLLLLLLLMLFCVVLIIVFLFL